jgi:hypothetical protein
VSIRSLKPKWTWKSRKHYIKSLPSLVYSKDVRLPQNLQRAMAAEAEATREARAKVSSIIPLAYA